MNKSTREANLPWIQVRPRTAWRSHVILLKHMIIFDTPKILILFYSINLVATGRLEPKTLVMVLEGYIDFVPAKYAT